MATAEELLAGVRAGEDTTLIIDNNLRTITIPKTITNLGVEHDDDVLTLKFKMPRYLGTTDLAMFAIRINYINAKGDTDAYTVNEQNKTITDESILFSWLVGPTATAYKGETKFIVCMTRTGLTDEGETIISREYNTTIASLPVLEGLEVDESIVTQYSDIIEQWRRELFEDEKTSVLSEIHTARDSALSDVQSKCDEVLATIPEEYQETAEAAQEGIRTKADAIVATADGTMITVSDSSDDHVRGLRIFGKSTQAITTGKNLLNVPETLELSNTHGVDVELSAGTYIVSLTSETHSGDQQPYLRFYTNNVWIELTDNLAQSAVLSQPETKVYIYTYGMSAAESDGVTASFDRLMVSVDGGDYEPYSGGFVSPSPDWPQETVDIINPSINIFGKNMLKIVAANQTLNGVAFTVNADGSITIKGTATEAAFYGLNYNIKNLIPGEVYSLTGCPAGGSSSTYRLYAQNSDGSKFAGDSGNGTSFTATDEQWQVLFVVYKGNTVNFTIYPELCLRPIKDTAFRPYVESPQIAIDQTLRGIPVKSNGTYTDSSGQQWICDEIDFERGVYIQRTKLFEDLSSATWSSWGVNNRLEGYTGFFYYYENLGNEVTDVVCSIAPHKGDLWGGAGFGVWSTKSGKQYIAISIPNNALADVSSKEAAIESFKTLLANTSAKFLTTILPIETALTAEQIEMFKNLRSNHHITTAINDSGAHMELVYNVDTKTYVDNGIQKTVAEVMEAIANGSY